MKTKDFIYIALIAILFFHSMWLQKEWVHSYECSVKSEVQLADRINEVSINPFKNDSLADNVTRLWALAIFRNTKSCQLLSS